MNATLVVFGERLGPAYLVSGFLFNINAVYRHYLEIENFLESNPSILDIPNFDLGEFKFVLNPAKAEMLNITIRQIEKSLAHGQQAALSSNEIILSKCNFNSPGMWEFIGKLNILEVIREYLNDRHSRRKDELYRMDIEHENQRIENSLKRLELYEKVINFGKKSGLSSDEVTELARRLIQRPIESLDDYQTLGIATKAEIRVLDSEEETV